MAPWHKAELYGWSIVGMNHYHVDGVRHLFVAMTRGDRCIKTEGPDDISIWGDLVQQAMKPCHSEQAA